MPNICEDCMISYRREASAQQQVYAAMAALEYDDSDKMQDRLALAEEFLGGIRTDNRYNTSLCCSW